LKKLYHKKYYTKNYNMFMIIWTLVLRLIAVDYMRLGIDLANNDDIDGAIEAFGELTVQEPESFLAWENLGVAFLRKGMKTKEIDPFRDSAMCFEMAYEMVNDPDSDLLDNIKALKETLLQMFPASCQKYHGLYDTCLLLKDILAEYKAEKKVKRESAKRSKESTIDGNEFQFLSEQKRKEYLMNVDCSESNLRYTVTKEDREKGYISKYSRSRLQRTFRDCGLILLDKVYDQELLDELKVAQEKYFEEWFKTNVFNTTKSEQRSKYRYEVWAPMIKPFTSDAFIRSPILLPIIKAVVNEQRLEINMLSSVTSLPGAPTQHWHRDSGSLFNYDEFPHPLPTYGAVMFLALVDLVKENGPTEFWLKAHHQCRKKDLVEISDGGHWFLDVCPWVKERIVVTGEIGTIMLFEYRMLHRGGPNKSSKRRSLMYLTWVREWWIDRVNFNAQHTADFDKLSSPQMRKLLSRIDSKLYHEKLDDVIRNDSVSFKRSKFHYSSYSYDVKAEL